MKVKCKRCGACCENVKIAVSPKMLRKSYEDWKEKRRNTETPRYEEIYLIYPALEYLRYEKRPRGWVYRCKHLVQKNGKATCSIYPNRSDMCKGYPWYDHEVLKVDTLLDKKRCAFAKAIKKNGGTLKREKHG